MYMYAIKKTPIHLSIHSQKNKIQLRQMSNLATATKQIYLKSFLFSVFCSIEQSSKFGRANFTIEYLSHRLKHDLSPQLSLVKIRNSKSDKLCGMC